MQRVIVVGDLHGCAEETIQLLHKCEVKPEDRVIFVGDLVDRGPDNDKCVDLVMNRELIQGSPACVMGNHEEKMLFYREIEQRRGSVEVQIPNHIATRKQLKPKHYEYFKTLPKFIELPEHNAIVVHAGMYPDRPLAKQTDRHLLHIQSIRPFDKLGYPTFNEKSMWPTKVPKHEEGWKFWTEFWKGPERIIFGHSVLDVPLITDKVAGVDGGCCFGRELWALVLPDWNIVSVKSKTHCDKGRNPVRIHGNVGTF